MRFQFTERAQRVILIAQEEAKRLTHDYVGTEHILLALIALGHGVAAQVLANLGVDLRRARSEIEKIVGVGTGVMLLGEIPFTPRAKKVLEYAVEEARHMGHSYVGTEYLLLGLIREEEGVAARVLENLGLRLDVVREGVINLLGVQAPIVKDPPSGRTRIAQGLIKMSLGLQGIHCPVRITKMKENIVLDVSVEVDACNAGLRDEPEPRPDLRMIEKRLLTVGESKEFGSVESFMYALSVAILAADQRIISVQLHAATEPAVDGKTSVRYWALWRESDGPGEPARK